MRSWFEIFLYPCYFRILTHFHERVPKNPPSMTKFGSAAFHGGDCLSVTKSLTTALGIPPAPLWKRGVSVVLLFMVSGCPVGHEILSRKVPACCDRRNGVGSTRRREGAKHRSRTFHGFRVSRRGVNNCYEKFEDKTQRRSRRRHEGFPAHQLLQV